jgi:predicted nuclease of restriction endonuclease-like (RecB) superfamily
MASNKLTTDEYKQWLTALKERIRISQIQAALKVNRELLQLYWELGQAIAEKEQQTEWGDKILDQLSADLREEFPEIRGFSRSNLFNIKKWHLFYSTNLQLVQQPVGLIGEGEKDQLVQHPVGQFPISLGLIPWGHHIQIITKCNTIEEAVFYLQQTAINNWSRNVLIHHIESQFFSKKGKALTNFESTLPKPQSDLAKELLKSDYNLDFLSLGPESNERDLENALVAQMKQFLLELGFGFAFIAQQYHLYVGDKDYYLDLLFYHTRLKCYVIVELKVGELVPEFIGKLNFYISAVDDQVKNPDDKPTIGLLLCKKADKVVAEYSLRDASRPLGIAEYTVLPEKYREELPSVEALQQELKVIELPEKPLDQKLSKLKHIISQLKTEGVKKERDKESIIYLFNEFLPALIERIEFLLVEVIPEFNKKQIVRSINDLHGHLTSVDIEAHLIKESVHRIGLNIQLQGFIRGGTKAFNIYKDIKLELYPYHYEIKVFLGQDKLLAEKLYHHQWIAPEIEQLAEAIAEMIIDDVNVNIERIRS